MKDHEKRELVDRITAIARQYSDAQQLRARIAGGVLAALDAAVAAERERCATLVETMDTTGHDGYIETTGDLCEALAARIRKAELLN